MISDYSDDSGDDGEPEVQMNLPSSVLSRIEELMSNDDQFDAEDFDAVAFVNRMFPTEQSLSGCGAGAARAGAAAARSRAALRAAAARLPAGRAAGRTALSAAAAALGRLPTRISDAAARADRSAAAVRALTADVQRLDAAKGNLTCAVAALHRLQLLARGAADLTAAVQLRQYRALPLPLQALAEVVGQLQQYAGLREVGALCDQVSAARDQLATQILADFKEAFTGSKSSISHKTLAEACAVVDVLDPKVKQQLLDWFVNLQLEEYRVVFSPEQECAGVAQLERRLAWLKRLLLSFEQTSAAAFPHHWKLSELIAHKFCQETREQLSERLKAEPPDVKLLLFALTKTRAFELLLHKRFRGTDYEVEMKESANSQEQEKSPWVGAIGSCFEPYLGVYISSLDANLNTMMDTFIQDAKASGNASGADSGADSGAGSGAVLASCAELFLTYRKCLLQCAALSTGEPMLQLANVFGRYLRVYATSGLGARLPPAPQAAVASLLLRTDSRTYSKEEISRICSVLVTAEYCLETTGHLQHKMREKVDPALAHRVDFSNEQDVFQKLLEQCVCLLVEEAVSRCEAALRAAPAGTGAGAGTASPAHTAVHALQRALEDIIPHIRSELSSSRKYFTAVCTRVALALPGRLAERALRSRADHDLAAWLRRAGAEARAARQLLLTLPTLGDPAPDVQPPASYTKVVSRAMSRVESILELGSLPPTPGWGATAASRVPDLSPGELRALLTGRGARRAQLETEYRNAVTNRQQ